MDEKNIMKDNIISKLISIKNEENKYDWAKM